MPIASPDPRNFVREFANTGFGMHLQPGIHETARLYVLARSLARGRR